MSRVRALCILLGVVAVGAIWLFNSSVRLRNRVREALSGVDVQLKRLHDLVPTLVRTVGRYARHEPGGARGGDPGAAQPEDGLRLVARDHRARPAAD